MPVVILSDTFYELVGPVLEYLGYPLLLCHNLIADEQGMILDFRLRGKGAKRDAVLSFQDLGYRVIAVGDSLNDIGMLDAADQGLFVSPCPGICEQLKRCPILSSLREIPAFVKQELLAARMSSL